MVCDVMREPVILSTEIPDSRLLCLDCCHSAAQLQTLNSTVSAAGTIPGQNKNAENMFNMYTTLLLRLRDGSKGFRKYYNINVLFCFKHFPTQICITTRMQIKLIIN